MEYLPGILQDVKLLRSSAGNQVKIFSKVIVESNVTANITRPSDSFTTVPPIVNVGEWGCTGHNLETIIVLVLLTLYFIPQRSQHSLSCQDNDYSLVDSLVFIDSQNYRYRTINKHMNCTDVNKWSADIVAIIPSFVESEKGLFRVTVI